MSLAIGIVVVFFAIKFLAPKASNTITLLLEAFLHLFARGAATGMAEANRTLREYDNRPVDEILLEIIDDKPTKKK